MKTGQIIKQLREDKGMTQEELAELMGYSHKSSINKIELGKADLPQSKLVAFAKIFDVNPCLLLGIESATNDDLQGWDNNINKVNIITKETKLIENIQSQWGKSAVKMLELFIQLNEQGQQKAIDNISDLTLIDQYKK